MVKDRRAKDQKRKAKLAKRAKEARKTESLAYLGTKFKTDALVPFLMETEIAIYEAYLMTERKLTDQQTKQALEQLVKQMRHQNLLLPAEPDHLSYSSGEEHKLVVENILRHWVRYFEASWQPTQEQRIGVVRTILGSLETHQSAGAQSQSFLHFIAEFLSKKVGVRVGVSSEIEEPHLDLENDELLSLGREWTQQKNQDARAEFFELANDLQQAGESTRVFDICHRLIGEDTDPTAEWKSELLPLIQQSEQPRVTSQS